MVQAAMGKYKISVTIITLNEEREIERCIKSVRSIADEIVVVDSGSTDRTVEFAKKLGAKVYFRKFDDYASQKNFATEKAKGDWILSIDADETVSEKLAEEIKEAIKQKAFYGYLIPRQNILLGAEIKHTRWSPDKHIWLWRKGKGRWIGQVHEEVQVEGWVGELKEGKIHYQYESVTEFLKMMNRYTDRMADEMVSQGKKFSLFMLFYAPLLSFFRRFFYKKGFLDGWRGFVLSYLMAIYRFTTWVKLWERDKSEKKTSRNRVPLVIISILILALALRLVAINQSLWLDETISANVVKN